MLGERLVIGVDSIKGDECKDEGSDATGGDDDGANGGFFFWKVLMAVCNG